MREAAIRWGQRRARRRALLPLPAAYRVLPADSALWLPGFTCDNARGIRVLCAAPEDTAAWFERFVGRLERAVGRHYLPVCRMGDGEFQFAVGPPPADRRQPGWRRLARRGRQLLLRAAGRSFAAGDPRRYASGAYSAAEVAQRRAAWGAALTQIAHEGILAPHLSYEPGVLFAEPSFPAVRRWWRAQHIVPSGRNCVPFYFVYAALTGAARHRLVRGRVLVVHDAVGAKRQRIVDRIAALGAREVAWCPLSSGRSLFDQVPVGRWVGRVDVALVGAGIGKPLILTQLRPLAVPCIDAGFVLETWADPRAAAERPYCRPDLPAPGAAR